MGRKRVVALLLSAALTLALCLTALPKTALAASTGPCIDLTSTPNGSGEGWTWASNTLTLTGLDYTSTDAFGIYLPANSTIALTAGSTNKVQSAYNGTSMTCGINCDGDLTVRGGGALTATSGISTSSTAGNFSAGIRVGGLTVSGGSKLTGVGARGPRSYGISFTSLTVTDPSVVKGEGGGGSNTTYSIGVIGDSATLSGGASLTGTAGNASNHRLGIQLQPGGNFLVGNNVTVIADASGQQATNTTRAFLKEPTISNYPVYYWRTAKADAYTLSSDNPYVYADSQVYVEIRPSLPGGGGGDATGGAETGADVPKTGDSAQPWLWAGLVLLAGAGLAGLFFVRTFWESAPTAATHAFPNAVKVWYTCANEVQYERE